ncbi:unnamed protein product [Schistocephalus solidus]|uniref:Condensation domain-containing protein n=1 Tax=Schistocephalus solidus TaxID=70667 RepID=A0A183TSL8_SCHSO|nr:unnamed protein product [Schistocephalus solidus]
MQAFVLRVQIDMAVDAGRVRVPRLEEFTRLFGVSHCNNFGSVPIEAMVELKGESWHSTAESTNRHIDLPAAYQALREQINGADEGHTRQSFHATFACVCKMVNSGCFAGVDVSVVVALVIPSP